MDTTKKEVAADVGGLTRLTGAEIACIYTYESEKFFLAEDVERLLATKAAAEAVPQHAVPEGLRDVIEAHCVDLIETAKVLREETPFKATANEFDKAATELRAALDLVPPVPAPAPIPMILHCPKCGVQHVDAPESRTAEHLGSDERWANPPHRSHLCHGCGHIWRPADVSTEGVEEIQTRGTSDSAPAKLGDDDSLFYPPKALLKREDWDTLTRKPKAPVLSKAQIVALANTNGIDTDTDGDIWGSTNGAIFKFAEALLAVPSPADAQEGEQISDEEAYTKSGYRHFMSFEKFKDFCAGVIPASEQDSAQAAPADLRDAALEEAAKVCELEAVASSLTHSRKACWQSEVAGRCAANIRALRSTSTPADDSQKGGS